MSQQVPLRGRSHAHASYQSTNGRGNDSYTQQWNQNPSQNSNENQNQNQNQNYSNNPHNHNHNFNRSNSTKSIPRVETVNPGDPKPGSLDDGDREQSEGGGENTFALVSSEDEEGTALTTRRQQQLTDERKVTIAVSVSLLCNVLLLAVKVVAAHLTGSMAVIAAAVDSFVDIFAQVVLYMAERRIRGGETDKLNYPIGKKKLEPIAVIICAALMGTAALELILQSVRTLYSGVVDKDIPIIDFSRISVIILISVIVLKFLLFLYCKAVAHFSASANALANDHMNDVLSNGVAITTAAVAHVYTRLWWVDSLGAIIISFYIIHTWTQLARDMMDQLVGKTADPQFLEEVQKLAADFHSSMTVDLIRAYHFGARYLVELEVVLPEDMPLRESHDIALSLQVALERMEMTERAFVHVDYMPRDHDEHNPDVMSRHRPHTNQNKSQKNPSNNSSNNHSNNHSNNPSNSNSRHDYGSGAEYLSARGILLDTADDSVRSEAGRHRSDGGFDFVA